MLYSVINIITCNLLGSGECTSCLGNRDDIYIAKYTTIVARYFRCAVIIVVLKVFHFV